MGELSFAKTEMTKVYSAEEQRFLLQCAKKNQAGSTATPGVKIENLMQRQDIVTAVTCVGEEHEGRRYKINDPLLHTIMNDMARSISSKVNVRGLVGTVVEGLVDELLETISANRITVNGIDLTGYNAISVSMKKRDVDSLMADANYENLIAFNIKFSNTRLTADCMKEFEKNIALLHTRFKDAKITVIHLAMVIENEDHDTQIRRFATSRGEHYWTLNDLIAAMKPMVANVEVLNVENQIWIKRSKVETILRNWVNTQHSGRISGHAGNGKTSLADMIGKEAAETWSGDGSGRKVVYVDLLRRTGRIL